MTLSDIANIGTLASAVAVLVSLVYLTIQVRQTERNQRAIINQAIATRGAENLRWSGGELPADLRTRVTSGDLEFSAREIMQLMFMLRGAVVINQDVRSQLRVGLADELTLATTLGALRAHLARPAFRAVWRMIRGEFIAETVAFVDRIAAETPLITRTDLVAQFQSELAQLAGDDSPKGPRAEG